MSEHIHGDVSRYDPKPLPPITSHNDAAPAPAPSLAPRELLKQRAAAVEAAKIELQRAQAFADKSARMLEIATAEFKQSQTVSHDVRAFKIAAFKKGSTDPLPTDLIEARREAIFAAEEFEHAEAVAGQMSNELAAAQGNLAAAESAKRDAVSAVVIEGAMSLIEELSRVNERRHHLRLVLQGLTVGTGAEAGRVASNLIYTGLQDHDQQLPMSRSPIKKAEAFWEGYSKSLAESPDAAVGEYPTLESLWS
jgi:hypothetical protein